MLKLESSWEKVKEKIKEINPEWSDEDLSYQKGEEDQLLERLSKKMNKSKEEVKGWIESVSFNKGKAG